MEFIFSVIPSLEKHKIFWEWLSGCISIFFFSFVLRYGIDIMNIVSTQRSPILDISMAIPYAALPVGAILLSANILASMLEISESSNSGVVSETREEGF